MLVVHVIYILHNAASKAANDFSKIAKFDLEDHCVDLYHWFEKSSKRKSALKEYYEFCDIEYAEVIRYASTRWLCLERCVNRELRKFEGLKSYFLSEGLSDARFQRLETSYQDPMTEVYLLFIQSILPVFTNFNKLLQSEEPLIYLLHDFQQKFMNKLATKFIKPEVIIQLKDEKKSFSELDLRIGNQKDDIDLSVGFITKTKLLKLLEEDIDESVADEFFNAVRQFFNKAYTYCVKWLPLDDKFIKHCMFVEFEMRTKSSFEDVLVIVDEFIVIREKLAEFPKLIDDLEEEFMIYQAMSRNEIPDTVWEEAKIKEENNKTYYRMDMIWAHLKGTLTLLSAVALAVLTVPHSNAAE